MLLFFMYFSGYLAHLLHKLWNGELFFAYIFLQLYRCLQFFVIFYFFFLTF